MSSEWMKVMLDEIARKKAEADAAEAETQRRCEEQESGLDTHGGRPKSP